MTEKDPVIAANEQFLEKYGADLQANIFSPHRKDHVLLLFLHINEAGRKSDNLIRLLHSLAENSATRRGIYLTSTKNQRDIESRQKGSHSRPELFCNLYLTAEGLQIVGKQDEWDDIITHLRHNAEDLQAHSSEPSRPVHAMLLLAHPVKDALVRYRRDLENRHFPSAGVELIAIEEGNVYRQKKSPFQSRGFSMEHFGYADGLTNPWITEQDIRNKTKPFYWNPTCSVHDFLVEEPGGSATEKRYGSYLVYRKIEQHVKKFKDAVTALAILKGSTPNEAGSLAFGRKTDGTPLEEMPTQPLTEGTPPNDFHFDGNGHCPVFAHIRKVNPRDHPPGTALPKKPQYPILRRGVTYGERKLVYGNFSDEDTATGVGLLFLSFQNGIDTYQKILKLSQQEEADPILGSLDNPAKTVRRQLRNRAGELVAHEGFGGFATLKDGLNLYAPSLQFFRELPLPEVSTDGDAARDLITSTDTTPPAMSIPSVNFPIFGDDRNSFLNVVNHYNQIKVGYDSPLLSYGREGVSYTVKLPETNGGTVPVRDQVSMKEILLVFQQDSDKEEVPLGFEFHVPVLKGFQIKVDASLSSWDGSEVLARSSTETSQEPSGRFYYDSPEFKSPEIIVGDGITASEYGFLPIVLNRATEGDLLDKRTFLQAKIRRWREKGTPLTNRLFVLRVQQLVWPSDKPLENVRSVFECRDDSVILEILD